MIVMKFGGTSVGTTESIDSATKIVAAAVERQAGGAGAEDGPDQSAESPGVLVVVSAMGGVTNTLTDAAQAAAAGDETPYRDARSQLLVRHQEVTGQLIEDGVEGAGLGRMFDNRLREFERLCRSITVLGELTQRRLDVVSGVGEGVSRLFGRALQRSECAACYFPQSVSSPTRCLKTAARRSSDLTRTRARLGASGWLYSTSELVVQ